MRLAYVYDAVHPWVTGGIQTRVWELSRRLARDHDVHWYGLQYWDGPSTLEKDGVTLHGVTHPPDSLYTNGRRSIPEALTFASRLIKPLARESFDVIDCQAFPYFSCFACKLNSLLTDSTLFVTWHEVWDDYWYEYLGYKGVFGQLTERLVARTPDRHIAVSNRTQRDAVAIGATDPTIIPNGISLKKIDTVAPVDRQIDILYAGRLTKEKNIPLLIQSLSELDRDGIDVKCLVVGEGPERKTLERLASEADLTSSVTFVDFRETHENVLSLMKAASVFALPSRREGFGISTLEALACGTPVVTVSHPLNAAQELIDPGQTGMICDSNPQSFADGLLAAFELDSEACRESAQDYDWDVIVNRVDEVYRTVA